MEDRINCSALAMRLLQSSTDYAIDIVGRHVHFINSNISSTDMGFTLIIVLAIYIYIYITI